MPSPAASQPLRCLNSLNLRATSHTRGLPLVLAFALVAALGGACDRSPDPIPAEGGTSATLEAARSQIEALRQSFTPISPSATSDKQRAWRDAKRDHLEQLERGPRNLAPAALEVFGREVSASDEWRSALLSVAAHTDRELACPFLEALSVQYDGKTTLGVRTEALRLLCETSPAAGAKLLRPILLEPRPSVTYPPKERMLRHWIVAARSIRQPIDDVLATIATDISQTADVRYVAVDELGAERESASGRKALETVLVESGSDGMLRRKAAQAMRDALPRVEFCAILSRVAERESDPAFIYFLADMLDKNCP